MLPVDDDKFNEKFEVINPTIYGNIVKYTVKGEDEKGPFESYRRFNEFFALQATLTDRWPGCYVPCIPEKKSYEFDTSSDKVGQWNVKTMKHSSKIEERRALFERFLRELSKYPFLLNSDEF